MSVIVKHIGTTWQLIEPFTRADRKTLDDLKDGETEFDTCKDFVHIVEWDGEPPMIVKLSMEEIEQLRNDPVGFRKNRSLYREKCFLWAISSDYLIIAREKIRNVKRTHDPDYICHTNLTDGGLAYIGGEVLFGEDGCLYVNWFSDRYGNPPEDLWEASKAIFNDLGYPDLVDILELI
jgi:hypothetical protein